MAKAWSKTWLWGQLLLMSPVAACLDPGCPKTDSTFVYLSTICTLCLCQMLQANGRTRLHRWCCDSFKAPQVTEKSTNMQQAPNSDLLQTSAAVAYVYHLTSGIELEHAIKLASLPTGQHARLKVMRFSQEHVQTRSVCQQSVLTLCRLQAYECSQLETLVNQCDNRHTLTELSINQNTSVKRLYFAKAWMLELNHQRPAYRLLATIITLDYQLSA